VTLRTFAPRLGYLPYWAIGLSLFAALAGVLPIAAALFGGAGAGPRTAFATAPAGTYVVFSNSGDTIDTVYVAPVDDPASRTEIAVVDHLPGYTPAGVVSPDGKQVALVVAEAGTLAHPGASILVVSLESGEVTRVAIDVDVLQAPGWTPDSSAVVFTRDGAPEGPAANVTIHRVSPDGSDEAEIGRYDGVLGAYVVGFDPTGQLVTVVIDGRGSTAYRDGQEVVNLSSQVTRDWELSPDGAQLAFIESDVMDGLTYRAKVVALDAAASAGAMSAQAADDAGQELGVAWQPGGAPTFGEEPAPAAEGEAFAQSADAGFDIPLTYSPDGRVLAVQAWSGASFQAAGTMRYELLRDGERVELSGVSRIYGWSVK
jgi:hypothetical protein